MSDASLQIKVGADVKDAVSGFKQVQTEASNTGQSVKDTGQTFVVLNNQLNASVGYLKQVREAEAAAAEQTQALGDSVKQASEATNEFGGISKILGLNLSQSRIAFQDLGRVIEGQSFSLRSISSNFSLLGPEVTIAAAAIGFISEALIKYVDSEKDAATATGHLNDALKDQAAILKNDLSDLSRATDLQQAQLKNQGANPSQLLEAKIEQAQREKQLRDNDLYDQQHYYDQAFSINEKDDEKRKKLQDEAIKDLDAAEQAQKNAVNKLAILNQEKISADNDAAQKIHDNQEKALEEQANFIKSLQKISDDAEQKEEFELTQRFQKTKEDLEKNNLSTSQLTEAYYQGIADIQQKYADKANAVVAKAFAEEATKLKETQQEGLDSLTKQEDEYFTKSESIGLSAAAKRIVDEDNKYKKLIDQAMLYGADIEKIELQHQQNLAKIDQENEKDQTVKNVADFQLDFNSKAETSSAQKALQEVLKQIQENIKAGNIDLAYKVSLHMDKTVQKQQITDSVNDINLLFQKVQLAAVEGIGTFLGNVLAGAKNPMNDVVKSIGNILGEGLEIIGKQLIEAAGIMAIIQTAIQALGTSLGPEAAVIAGIAAIAAGTLIKAEVSKVTATAFADGGIVTGPTYGLVGEAGPEAIIPLGQMDKVIRSVTGNGAGAMTVNVRGQLSGQNMILLNARATKNQTLV